MFNTAGLPDDAVISGATLSLYGNLKTNGLGSLTIGVVSSNPAANNTIAASDFNIANFGATDYGTRYTYAGFSTSAYNDMAFNATGIAAISKTGITKLGTRLGNDIDDSSPTWSSLAQTYFYAIAADTTGTSTDPKLVVTYSLPTTGGMLLMGIG